MVEWIVPRPPPPKREPPKCPICGSPLNQFDSSTLNSEGTAGVDHFKCPMGHTAPENCNKHLNDCVLDVPWATPPPFDACPCPCPHCGECHYLSIGVCNEGGLCAEKVKCLRCGNEYVCPMGKGDVCPYCCERGNVVIITMYGADGKPQIVNGYVLKAKYCKKCKKGVSSLAGTKPPCGAVTLKREPAEYDDDG